MDFASRVVVRAADGGSLVVFYAHRAAAERMLKSGQAVVHERRRDGVISELRMAHSLEKARRDEDRPTSNSLITGGMEALAGGQKLTLNRLDEKKPTRDTVTEPARNYRHKYIHPSNRSFYGAAALQSLVVSR